MSLSRYACMASWCIRGYLRLYLCARFSADKNVKTCDQQPHCGAARQGVRRTKSHPRPQKNDAAKFEPVGHNGMWSDGL